MVVHHRADCKLWLRFGKYGTSIYIALLYRFRPDYLAFILSPPSSNHRHRAPLVDDRQHSKSALEMHSVVGLFGSLRSDNSILCC